MNRKAGQLLKNNKEVVNMCNRNNRRNRRVELICECWEVRSNRDDRDWDNRDCNHNNNRNNNRDELRCECRECRRRGSDRRY